MSEVVGALELVCLEKSWDGQKGMCAEREKLVVKLASRLPLFSS